MKLCRFNVTLELGSFLAFVSVSKPTFYKGLREVGRIFRAATKMNNLVLKALLSEHCLESKMIFLCYSISNNMV